MKVSLVSVALALSAASATDISSRATQLEEAEAVTDNLLFNISLTEFERFRADRNPGYLDWTSDSCSYSPDNPLWFPFSPGCERHDFGYRNYRNQSRFIKSNKDKIDSNFHSEYVLTTPYTNDEPLEPLEPLEQ